MKKVNKFDHSNVLKICNEKSGDITDDERLILNTIAGAYATDEPVDKDTYRQYYDLFFRFHIELNLD